MPIELDKVLGAKLPPMDFSWDEDQLILYALGAGIGIGADATTRSVLQYTYENDLKALPTFGVVPSFAALMSLVSLDGLSFNPMMLLHGEQYLEILERPIPTRATVQSEGTIKAVYDKGKGALLVIEVTTATTDGTPLFRNEYGIFLRGEGGFGGEPGPPAAHPEDQSERVASRPYSHVLETRSVSGRGIERSR